MKKSARIAGFVFLAIALTDVILLTAGNETVPVYIKPFLMLSLLAAALLALLPEHKGKLTTLMSIGLLFHNVGDILLLFDKRSFLFFALGLGCFFIGHLFYLAVFRSGMGRKAVAEPAAPKGKKGWETVVMLAPLVLGPLVAISFGAVLPMTIALTIYSLALFYIMATGIVWALRGKPFAWRVIIGALLFIISDVLIGILVFDGITFPLRHAAVIATYLAAEWLLVSAMVRTISGHKS